MKLYYIANALMPNDKAHGIQIAKTCEAFIENGVDVTLVVPHREGSSLSLKEFYGLRVNVPMVRLPVIDLHNAGPIRYRIGALLFVASYLWYFYTRVGRKHAAVYTVDLDHIACLGLPFLRLPYFSEMHGTKNTNAFYTFFFKKIRGVIATTPITKEELTKRFNLPDKKVLLEPNGVDLTHHTSVSRADARKQLGIPLDTSLVLYVGRVLGWKGIDILPQVAEKLPGVTIGFLGATSEEYERIIGTSGKPVVFYGSRPHAEVETWLAAADACLVIGTPRDEYSYRYTSPMKVFEYLGSGRPIIASATPALQGVLAEGECFYFTPDSVESLVSAISECLSNTATADSMATRGVEKAKEHTWKKRAERIARFIETSLEKPSNRDTA